MVQMWPTTGLNGVIGLRIEYISVPEAFNAAVALSLARPKMNITYICDRRRNISSVDVVKLRPGALG